MSGPRAPVLPLGPKSFDPVPAMKVEYSRGPFVPFQDFCGTPDHFVTSNHEMLKFPPWKSRDKNEFLLRCTIQR